MQTDPAVQNEDWQPKTQGRGKPTPRYQCSGNEGGYNPVLTLSPSEQDKW